MRGFSADCRGTGPEPLSQSSARADDDVYPAPVRLFVSKATVARLEIVSLTAAPI